MIQQMQDDRKFPTYHDACSPRRKTAVCQVIAPGFPGKLRFLCQTAVFHVCIVSGPHTTEQPDAVL